MSPFPTNRGLVDTETWKIRQENVKDKRCIGFYEIGLFLHRKWRNALCNSRSPGLWAQEATFPVKCGLCIHAEGPERQMAWRCLFPDITAGTALPWTFRPECTLGEINFHWELNERNAYRCYLFKFWIIMKDWWLSEISTLSILNLEKKKVGCMVWHTCLQSEHSEGWGGRWATT